MNRLALMSGFIKLRVLMGMVLYHQLVIAAWSPAATSQYQISEKSRTKLMALLGRKSTEQLLPFAQGAPAPQKISDLKGYNELVPFVTPSPDQEDAGTCLFMSLTGIAEWFLQRNSSHGPFKQDGPSDLSERWWVNVNSRFSSEQKFSNWATDTIYLYNQFAGVLNSSYRYTKNWFQVFNNLISKSFPGEPGAKLGTSYNWIDETKNHSLSTVRLPTFQRIVLHKDTKGDPWNFGEAPALIVEQVKRSLQLHKAPVQVIYNHLGYWHSVFIVGFDDNLPSMNCYFIRETKEFYRSEIAKVQSQISQIIDKDLKSELMAKKELLIRNQAKLETVHRKNGGCRSRGMFYVRDSQYSDAHEEIYHYDLKHPEYSRHYSKRLILREYNWLMDLANHVIQITATP